jgi:hypothetical protein
MFCPPAPVTQVETKIWESVKNAVVKRKYEGSDNFEKRLK